MAKQDGNQNGHYRGSLGKQVGYQWRGQWCVRTKPATFHDAKSERQLEQRALFKAAVAFAGRAKEVLRVGLRVPSLAAHKTECNYFQMINKQCLTWDGEGLSVDYAALRVSEGPVAPVGFESAEREDDRAVTFHFDKNPEHRRAAGDDKVYIAAILAGEGTAVLSVPAYRRMKAVTIILPEQWAGCEVHLYGFVQDYAGRTSGSIYLGTFTTEDADLQPSNQQLPDEVTPTPPLPDGVESLAQNYGQTCIMFDDDPGGIP